MKKIQILYETQKFNHAGTKAVDDAVVISEEIGYTPYVIRIHQGKGVFHKIIKQLMFLYYWLKLYKTTAKDSLLFLQHPSYRQIGRSFVINKLRNRKNVKVVSLVHDVEELRMYVNRKNKSHFEREFDFLLNASDFLIVHNEVMKEHFINKGVEESRLIVLEIFDYLQKPVEKKNVYFSKSVTIAGNLNEKKCPYISRLNEIKNVEINLYGPNYNHEMDEYSNIVYHGSFPPDEIPEKLVSGFGLIWDGNSIETCDGYAGNYLRYNNPHKLSLYISSGLPVIIWKEAALADFVVKNKIGFAIDSLENIEAELNQITKETYEEFKNNVTNMSGRLRNGYYLKKAICACETKFKK